MPPVIEPIVPPTVIPTPTIDAAKRRQLPAWIREGKLPLGTTFPPAQLPNEASATYRLCNYRAVSNNMLLSRLKAFERSPAKIKSNVFISRKINSTEVESLEKKNWV